MNETLKIKHVVYVLIAIAVVSGLLVLRHASDARAAKQHCTADAVAAWNNVHKIQVDDTYLICDHGDQNVRLNQAQINADNAPDDGHGF